MDKVGTQGPAEDETAALFQVKGIMATMPDSACIPSTRGGNLSAVDGNNATDAISTVPIFLSTTNGRPHSTTRGIDHATVDGDDTAGGVVLVATQTCTSRTSRDVDGAAVDDERAHLVGAYARFIVVAAVDVERAPAVDGQSLPCRQFDAFRGIERATRAEHQAHGSIDRDALADIYVTVQEVSLAVLPGRVR